MAQRDLKRLARVFRALGNENRLQLFVNLLEESKLDLARGRVHDCFLARLLGLEPPEHAHVPLVLGPDGARLAKRHGAVTLDDVDGTTAVHWMARSLGLPPARTAADLLDGFDPAALPRAPTRFAGF